MPFTENQVKQSLINYLANNPGTPARRISRDFQDIFPGITKRTINPILYRERQLFRSEGFSPPIWFSIQSNPLRTPTVRVARPVLGTITRVPQPSPPLSQRTVPQEVSRNRQEFIVTDERLRNVTIPRFNQELFKWQREAILAWKNNRGKGL